MPVPSPPRRPSSNTTHPAGPFCSSCDHRTCRTLRALRLPILGGHRCEFAEEHLRAAAIQADNPHLILWFGESTQSYWVATAKGLTEARTAGELLLLVDPDPGRAAPVVTRPSTRRPWEVTSR